MSVLRKCVLHEARGRDEKGGCGGGPMSGVGAAAGPMGGGAAAVHVDSPCSAPSLPGLITCTPNATRPPPRPLPYATFQSSS